MVDDMIIFQHAFGGALILNVISSVIKLCFGTRPTFSQFFMAMK